jgi:hypothetical protein
MYAIWWMVVGVCGVLAVLGLLAWPAWRRRRDAARLTRACKLFHLRREWLEADFVKMASRAIKPRGLQWSDCDFEDEAAFATDRNTRQLRAFVAVTIHFESLEGVESAGDRGPTKQRAGTAVFHFDGRRWLTDGRAIFNLNPLEAIEHFQHELEMVD